MVEGGMQCVKYFLFSFNFVVVIAAIAMIAVGAYVQIKLTDYYDFFENKYTAPGILLICVGVFIFIIAFFGCMGAAKENHCMIMAMAVLLSIVFVLMVGVGIAAYVLHSNIEDKVTDILLKAEENYNKDGGVANTWDQLQKEFTCCGVKNYTEWKSLNLKTTYPRSCCISDAAGSCPKNSSIPVSNIIKTGCEDAFVSWVKSKVAILGGVGIGLAFLMVVGVLFACCLASAIREEYVVV